MATSFGDNLSDEIINIKCCFCAEDNRIREADTYCVECKNYYCAPCTETHRKFPGTKGHKLLDKSDFRSLGPDGSLPSFPTQRCLLHPARVVDMFCGDHNEVACASCMFHSHRFCKNVLTIPDEIGRLCERTEMTDAKQKLYDTKLSIEKIKKAKERKVQEVKKEYDKEVDSIKAFRKELEELLDDMEYQTIQELKKEYDRIESILTGEINEVNKLLVAMNEESLHLRRSEGNKAQEFISVKTSEKVTVKAEHAKKDLERKAEESVSFVADKNIKSALQEIKVLGKVSCQKQNTIYKVKDQREIDIKLASDRHKDEFYGECYIWGSCITADGSLLLTDVNNNKLKQFDINKGTLIDYIEFKTNPWDVCLVHKTESVVTLSNKCIQFVSLNNKLTATRSLKMNHDCRGLAYIDSKLFISNARKNVYIYDMNGQELRTVSIDASGKEIFQQTGHISFSDAGDRVFVADYKRGLVILDNQGNYLSTLSKPKLSGTEAVCTGGRNLFVGGYNSNTIVQIGQDNKLLGEIGKFNPVSLCFDFHKTRLIVTQFKTNKITILDLEL